MAQRRKSILNKDSIAEQEIINNVYIKDAPNSVHLNPTATRKEIIKNISDENQKIMNNKKNNEMNDLFSLRVIPPLTLYWLTRRPILRTKHKFLSK